ncbi:DUF2339 domain-containing protein [Sphingomonas sp. BGYR3]|uniref:DUF2339 domain-containing protein n=1 Tax=Sphingomonas sp. BGYR3 TaxID=2975483 RepID=UPI0021A6B952|nr:DUF2339 domain-containing protein [Sphingomonas sp. BGYR3]MDG5489823.1 DUF2339 domain-containing protein [Sphingomonas sp. BGYR3]
MDAFFILLFGVIAALLWQRLTRIERKMASMAAELAALRSASPDRQPADPWPAIPSPVADEPAPKPQTIVAEFAAEQPPEPVMEPVPVFRAEPLPPPEPGPEPVDTAEPVRGFSFDFEEIFGRRLPIWGGGFALAIAGIFLVRFSIEAGLLTPGVRVAMSFLFGLGLLAGAEAAYRLDERVADPRVRQALAGAGLATLYGAFYLAGTAYGLMGAGPAFAGLAAVTAAAIALSFRFGLPSAVIGLIGGFAAPLLVTSDGANVPLLSFYLILVTGGLAWSGQAQRHRWLSYAALTAGLGWGALMMVAGVSGTSDFAALGVYLIVLGAVLPAFLHARGGPSVPHLVAGGLATLQMAVLVTNAGFAPLTWGMYLLIGAALTALGWRFDTLRLGTLVAAGIGLWLIAIWPRPDPQLLAGVAAAQIAIFAAVPLALHWRGKARLLDLVQLSAVPLIMGAILYSRFGRWAGDASEPMMAAVLAGLAVLPVAGFALSWQRGEQGRTREVLAPLASGALLAFAALLLITPEWAAPIMAMAVSGALIAGQWRRDAPALHAMAWAGAVVTALTLMVTPAFTAELAGLGSRAVPVDMVRAVLRWAAATVPFAALAMTARPRSSRSVAEVGAVALGYGMIAQVLPGVLLAWMAAAGVAALFLSQRSRTAAWLTALAIAGIWALEPLVGWTLAGTMAAIGDPFLASSAIGPRDLALHVAPLCAALILLAWRGATLPVAVRRATLVAVGIVAAILLHSVYKQLFGITSRAAFVQYGMGERTLWQAMLLLAGLAVARLAPVDIRRPAAIGLMTTGLAHFGWFTLILHNPLWYGQDVGPVPVANWLTPAYLVAIAGLVGVQRQWGPVTTGAKVAVDTAIMALISLFALSLLRQGFAGPVLIARGIDPTESLLISLLGIVLALGFLWWGSRGKLRSWRIGSLVLMLGAVVKVFLIDAAGLDGLLRIASFMALGFSLIGIGWVYSRQLSRRTDSAA